MTDTTTLSWTTPICEVDWIDQNSAEVDGALAIRQPSRMTQEHVEIETCGFCGKPTIFGVYVRVDPSTIPYPRRKA